MSADRVLRLRHAGRLWQRVVSVPFLGFGLLALWALSQADAPGPWLWFAFLLLGTGFALAGGLLLFGGIETEVDRGDSSVTQVFRLLGLCRRRRREIGLATQVVLGADDRRGTSADDFDSRAYTVWVAGPDPAEPGIQLISEGRYPAARAHAVAAAEHLALPLVDRTSDTPGDVGPPPPAGPAPGSRFLQPAGEPARLHLRTPGLRGIHVGYLAVGLGFPLAVHCVLVPASLGDWSDPLARVPTVMSYGLFAVVPSLIVLPPALRSLTERLQLCFDSTHLTVRRRWLLGGSHRRVERSQIERVDLAASSRSLREPGLHGWVVRVIEASGAVSELGTLLSRREACWLRDEIRRRTAVGADAGDPGPPG